MIQWGIPRQDNRYIERSDLLKALSDQLPLLGGPSRIVISAINGLGGIGKTQLALHYIRHPPTEYEYTLCVWFPSETPSLLSQKYYDFGREMQLKIPSVEDAPKLVKTWLESGKHRFLLVYDNVEDYYSISHYLPDKNIHGHIILTSRFRNWPGSFSTLEIDLMDESQAIVFVKLLSGRDDTNIVYLVRELGRLTLSLAQASSYIKINQCSVTSYLVKYQQNRGDVLNSQVPVGSEHVSVMVTWDTTLEVIKKKERDENRPSITDLIMTVCAYLSSDVIPETLLTRWLIVALPSLPNPNEHLGACKADLINYWMITISGDDTFVVHRVVQKVLRIKYERLNYGQFTSLRATIPTEGDDPHYKEQWFDQLLTTIQDENTELDLSLKNRTLQRDEHNKKKSSLLPNMITLSEFYREFSDTRFTNICRKFGRLDSMIGQHYFFYFNYTLADKYLSRAQEIQEKNGEEPGYLSKTLLYYGDLQHYFGYSIKRKALVERALQLSQETNDLYMQARCMVSLGNVIGDIAGITGNDRLEGYEQKRQHLENAIQIYGDLNTNGLYDEEIAIANTNLAHAYRFLGNFPKQMEIASRNLLEKEKLFGKDSSQYALSLYSIGTAYGNLGKVDKEIEYIEKAVKIQESNLGPENWQVGIRLPTLASAYFKKGDKKKTEELLRRAVTILSPQTKGPDGLKRLEGLKTYLTAVEKGEIPEYTFAI